MIRFAVLAACAIAAVAAETSTKSVRRCVAGRTHTLNYTATTAVTADKFLDLDGMASKLSGVTCDIDHTRLTLSFKHRADAIEWIVKLHDFDNHFIVGGAKWNCSRMISSTSSRSSFILRRVIAASESAHLGRDIIITTAMARYDEIFSDADISYGILASEPCEEEADASKHICLGYNTNCKGSATASLPLYSGKHITASCASCFAALDADVFVNIRYFSQPQYHTCIILSVIQNV